MQRNVDAFGRLDLKQFVMRDVSGVDTTTTLLGRTSGMPLALAPIGMAGMMAQRAEVSGARAAELTSIPFTTSTLGICSVKEIRAATQAPPWFQLYMLKDRDIVLELLERARDSGVDTLVFTVDLAYPGMRLRDFRNGMLGSDWRSRLSRGIQIMSRPNWVYHVALKGKPHSFGNLSDRVDNPDNMESYRSFVESQFDPSVTWDDIRWLRDNWQGKLLIKGVMECDDALAAAGVGANGVIVSNHGGRQLDGVSSSLEKLPAIKAALPADIEIFLDGGVRSGIDVVKALALGARGVLIGRPWIWALAARGEPALISLLQLFQREIAIAMALTGVTRTSELSPDHLEAAPF